jgi:uncharacterized protein YcbX/ferredoxin
MISLSQISIYPLKSTAGNSLKHCKVETIGIADDRRFMLALADGSMVTSRQFPELLQVCADTGDRQIQFRHPEQKPLKLNFAHFSMELFKTHVWDDNFSAYKTSQNADLWFSALLKQPAVLLYLSDQSPRLGKKANTQVSFADAYPLLIISKASLDELNRRSPIKHTMAQFRPNIVVSGTQAFAEDGWKKIKIGEVIFILDSPCSRCILTTFDPKTSKPKTLNEPLTTLAKFRANESGEIFFGQNARVLNSGIIQIGDKIEILDEKKQAFYLDRFEIKTPSLNNSLSNEPIKRNKKILTININGKSFEANNQKTLLEQAETAGIQIPSKCRSGLCGTCKLRLVSGEVDQREEKALPQEQRNQGLILACCCIPLSDINVQAIT